MIWVKECIRFVVARLATGLLEIVMVPLLVAVGLNQKIFNVNGMLAKILVSIIVVIVNYIFGKMIFKKDKNTR